MPLVLLALISIAAPLEAQPNCKKGKPCGNSCIAQNKTCRIGATPAPAPSADARAAGLVDLSAGVVKDNERAWVAFRDGSIYYRNVMACEPARVPVKPERVYFKSAADARRAGLSASREAGCQ